MNSKTRFAAELRAVADGIREIRAVLYRHINAGECGVMSDVSVVVCDGLSAAAAMERLATQLEEQASA